MCKSKGGGGASQAWMFKKAGVAGCLSGMEGEGGRDLETEDK